MYAKFRACVPNCAGMPDLDGSGGGIDNPPGPPTPPQLIE
jgi:hypothetical protein